MVVTVDSLTRELQSDTEEIDLDLQIGTIVEKDATAGGVEGFFVPIEAPTLDQPALNVADVTTVNADPTITTTNDGFALVEVGDLVAGTGIPVGAVVQSKTDNNTVILDQAATAAGTITGNFDPNGGNPIDLTIAAFDFNLVRSPKKLLLQIIYHDYDGSLLGTTGTEANSSSQEVITTIDLKVDSKLSNARVPRSA